MNGVRIKSGGSLHRYSILLTTSSKEGLLGGGSREHQKLGFKLVRMRLFWSQVNSKPGVWDFLKYDEIVELARRRRLLVLIQLVPESASYWLIEEHKDALYVDADGRPIILHARPAISVEGAPCLCPDVPEVKEAVK